MVAAECDAGTADCCVVIRPNCSLTWRAVLVVFGGISLVSIAIALGFLLLGYWLILPFAGLELVALGAALYIAARKAAVREVISIRGSEVAVQKGRRRPEQTHTFPRGWVLIELLRPLRRGYPTRLFIRSHGREVEIGGCLVEAERCRLAEDLRRWVRPTPVPLPAA